TPGEVAGEVLELGRLATVAWLRAVERLAEAGLERPTRAAARLLGGAATPAISTGTGPQQPRPDLRGSLQERGAELLRRSADVGYAHDQHPAYRRILEELAPDEARILRLLAG